MAAELAKKRGNTTAVDLEKKLSNRPVAQDLQARNILKSGDPNLQAAKQALQKSQTKDVLSDKLQNRPHPSELKKTMSESVLSPLSRRENLKPQTPPTPPSELESRMTQQKEKWGSEKK